MSSVEKTRGKNWRDAEILTLIRIWSEEGIQEYHDYLVIYLSRSKYFSVLQQEDEFILLYHISIYLISDLAGSILSKQSISLYKLYYMYLKISNKYSCSNKSPTLYLDAKNDDFWDNFRQNTSP